MALPAKIERLDGARARALLPGLAALLTDAVDHGASVGFYPPPLAPDEAEDFFRSLLPSIDAGARLAWAALSEAGEVLGSVQLDLCQKTNGLHRAELVKLLVHTRARRQGLGRALVLAAQAEARALGRTTLVLDTIAGEPSGALYRALGWTPAGRIPRYARSQGGALDATEVYFLLL